MGQDWPKREEGWEEALQERTRRLFADVAERHGLEWDPEAGGPVEVSAVYPEQPGLEFRLWLTLQWDEIVLGGEDWTFDRFPVDDPENWDIVERTVDGLVSGDARVLLYTSLLRPKPFWTEVQIRDGDGWKTVSTGLGCAIIPLSRLTILQNGRGARRKGGLVPAWGCIGTLAALAGVSSWLLA